MVDSVVLSCACAREVSSSVPRPASSRACGEFERLLLVLDVAARDGELRLLAAQLEVGTGDFRDDRDLRVVQAGFRALELRALRASIPRRTPPKRSSSQVASKPAS